MPARLVNVYGLARKHDRGGDIAQQWNESSGIGGGKTERIHEQVGTGTDDATERGEIMSVCCVEPSPFFYEVVRHPCTISSCQVYDPTKIKKPASRRSPQDARASKDNGSAHCRESAKSPSFLATI
jgi:hypothetical protein